MSKIAKVQANKKHNVPDFKVIGSVIPDIIKKINGIVIEKKKNDVIDVIDYINNRILGTKHLKQTGKEAVITLLLLVLSF